MSSAAETTPGIVRESTVPRGAAVLGWCGVIPFAALTAAALGSTPLDPAHAERLLVLYGAVILSFMGGVHWGLAISGRGPNANPDTAHLTASVLPALVGWVAALLSTKPGIIVLVCGFLVLLAYDIRTVRANIAPRWYARLRIQLTLVVVCLLATNAVLR